MKVIYLNNWLAGSWQVQKIHAQEFINSFKGLKGVKVYTYPKKNIGNLKSQTVSGNKKKFYIGKSFIKKNAPGFMRYRIDKLLDNKKIRKIIREINYIRPDVILTRHNLSYFPIIEELLRRDVPIILEVNGLVQSDAKWINLKVSKKALEKELKIVHNVQALCCVSHNLGQSIERLGTDPQKIFVVPNGVNPSKFFPHEKSGKLCKKYDLEGKIVIGYVGGFESNTSEGRDVIGMLKALKIVGQKTQMPIKLLMVGRMDEKLLSTTVKELGIADLVLFTGFIEHDRLPDVMNLIDIAVAPYFEERLKEASPMKLFEYMAMEKPTVIPGIGQVSEIVQNMESAILVETENILSMAEALSLLIKDDNLREKIGRKARRLVISNYTWQHNAMRIAEICRMAVRNSRIHQTLISQ